MKDERTDDYKRIMTPKEGVSGPPTGVKQTLINYVINIQTSQTNTIINITNINGNTILSITAGSLNFNKKQNYDPPLL